MRVRARMRVRVRVRVRLRVRVRSFVQIGKCVNIWGQRWYVPNVGTNVGQVENMNGTYRIFPCQLSESTVNVFTYGSQIFQYVFVRFGLQFHEASLKLQSN